MNEDGFWFMLIVLGLVGVGMVIGVLIDPEPQEASLFKKHMLQQCMETNSIVIEEYDISCTVFIDGLEVDGVLSGKNK